MGRCPLLTLPGYCSRSILLEYCFWPFLLGCFPVGPDQDGTLARILFPVDSAGILFLAVPTGMPFPVGPDQDGTLSPTDPAGILFPVDSAGILFPVVPTEMPFPVGPDQDGTLSPTDPAGILFLADSAGMLFPAVPSGIPFPVDPDIDGTLSPIDPAGILFPTVLTEFPVSMDPVVALWPPGPTAFDTGGVVDIAVVGEVRPAVPDVFDSLAVVAMVEVDAVQTVEGIPMDNDGDCDIRDPWNDFETVDGIPVYYGGDFNDSDCEDPRDLAYEDWVDWYNSNAPVAQYYGCYGNDGRRGGSAGACVTGFVGGISSGDGFWDNGASGGHSHGGDGASITAESKDPRNEFETVHGMPVYYGGDLNDSDCETPGDNDYDTWQDWCDSDILDRYCGFPPDDEETQLPVIICAPVLRGKT